MPQPFGCSLTSRLNIGVARGAVDAGAPSHGEKIFLGAEFMEVSCNKCIFEGESADSQRGGVTFLLSGGGCGV